MSFIIKNTRMSRLNSDHEILYSAIMENDKYKIDRLFKAGIDFNVKYDRGMNILHLAGYYSKSRINLQRNMMEHLLICLLYTSPSPRDRQKSRMPSSA